MNLCKYKNIFGEPGTGVHSIRLFNIAIVDLTLTVLLAYFISKAIKKNFWVILILTLLSGIVVHRLFCVNSTINKTIFNEI
jgi:hypothetical protein